MRQLKKLFSPQQWERARSQRGLAHFLEQNSMNRIIFGSNWITILFSKDSLRPFWGRVRESHGFLAGSNAEFAKSSDEPVYSLKAAVTKESKKSFAVVWAILIGRNVGVVHSKLRIRAYLGSDIWTQYLSTVRGRWNKGWFKLGTCPHSSRVFMSSIMYLYDNRGLFYTSDRTQLLLQPRQNLRNFHIYREPIYINGVKVVNQTKNW